MIEQKAAKAIGHRGYSYWTGKAVSKLHSFVFVPHSGGGGWDLYCSCGEYSATSGMWAYLSREEVQAELNAAHRAHLVHVAQAD